MPVPTRWMWWGLLPILGAWVPLVAGLRTKQRSWIAGGAAIVVVASILVLLSEEDSGFLDGMFGITWLVHAAISLMMMKPYRQRMSVRMRYQALSAEAEHIDEERRAVLELARRDPARALDLGVGRPDLPRTRHGFVVDVNHAPAGVLATLPGVTNEVAGEIVRVRGEVGRFASIDEVGLLLDLDPGIVIPLRPRTVAL